MRDLMFIEANMTGKYHAKHFFDPVRRIRFMLYKKVLFAWDVDREIWVIYSESLTNGTKFNKWGRQ